VGWPVAVRLSTLDARDERRHVTRRGWESVDCKNVPTWGLGYTSSSLYQGDTGKYLGQKNSKHKARWHQPCPISLPKTGQADLPVCPGHQCQAPRKPTKPVFLLCLNRLGIQVSFGSILTWGTWRKGFGPVSHYDMTTPLYINKRIMTG
jgi:hypothetical protein